MVFRLLAIVGVLLFVAAGVLTWQGQRELPLWLGGAGALLVLPALNRAHRRWADWSKDMHDRASSIEP